MSWKNMVVACAATIMVSSLGAAYYNDPCCEPCPSDCGLDFCCDPCDGWTIYGDYLYWTVRRCDIAYAIPYNDDVSQEFPLISGSVKTVCTDYDSGFRVGVLKECGDIDFGVHYTRFHYHDSSKAFDANGNLAAVLLQEPLFVNLNGDLVFAKAHYEIDYDVVDVEVGYDLDFGACANARVFGGFKYANICQDLKVEYFDEVEFVDIDFYDRVRSKVDMDAYGLYLGADASYTICDCLDLFGAFSYGALVADFDRHLKVDFDASVAGDDFILETFVNLKDECWKLVSNLNLAVGIEYNLNNCFCADWAIAIGYEFHHWICVLDFLELESSQQVNDFDTPTSFRNSFSIDRSSDCLGFDGLFVRLAASF